jgi:hypothetical protein
MNSLTGKGGGGVRTKASPAHSGDTWARTVAGFRALVDRVNPWLLDLGNWIFGALIAFNLVILGGLFTVGPVDNAILVATAALALALPQEVAGFVLLRLAMDLKKVDIEKVATKAFVEVGFSVEYRVPNPRETERRRARVVLLYSYGLLALTALLTLIGATAALWHMSWWIALLFVVMVVVSPLVVFGAIASSGSKTTWRTPAGEMEPREDKYPVVSVKGKNSSTARGEHQSRRAMEMSARSASSVMRSAPPASAS